MRATRLCRALLIGALCAEAGAQSINIDLNAATGPGAGAPAPTFGAAAAQPGVWNAVPPTGAGPFALARLNGAASGVILARSGTTLSFGFNSPATSGDHELLLDDIASFASTTPITHTFSGLTPGRYIVRTYAIAPDSSTLRTFVTVSGSSSPNPQNIGGAMPANAFTESVTHARHITEVITTLQVIVQGNTSAGSLNGLQLTFAPEQLHVSAASAPGGDGLSWETAFNSIEDALAAARRHEGLPTEIWVASGVYSPTARRDMLDPRSVVFSIPNAVTLRGGFNGTEFFLEDRNMSGNETVLDADTGLPGDPSDNAYHLILMDTPGATARVEGFTLRNANNTLDECADPCAEAYAGAVRIEQGHLTIDDCLIRDNTAGTPSVTGFGGGLFVRDGAFATLRRTDFLNNAAHIGGGLFAGSDAVVVASSRFLGNHAELAGGGAAIASNEIINCVFSANTCADGSPAHSGAALWTAAAPVVRHATFVANSGPAGAEVLSAATPGVLTVFNSIVWDNPIPAFQGASVVTYSNIQGGYSAKGNISADPQFIDPLGPDGIAGTLDDDPRIGPLSPCIDAGTFPGVDTADLDNDKNTAETLPLDLAGNPRLVDIPGVPNATAWPADMGANEVQPCDRFLGDANRDGVVDFNDITAILANWLADYTPATGPGDANYDGVVDFNDITAILSNWLGACP